MSRLFVSGGQSFSFSISLSNEYSGLISFRMDWFDLLAVQGTVKRLLRNITSKCIMNGYLNLFNTFPAFAELL